MNREILFKARREEWRTLPEEKHWVEGNLLYSKEGTYISTSFIIGKREIPMVVAISYLVEPETVSQYIGRIDITGKKIFENDMVQYKIMISDGHGKSELKEVIGRVKWMEERLGFGVPQIINNKNYDDFRECTVVGNYFDEQFFGGRELVFI